MNPSESLDQESKGDHKDQKLFLWAVSIFFCVVVGILNLERNTNLERIKGEVEIQSFELRKSVKSLHSFFPDEAIPKGEIRVSLFNALLAGITDNRAQDAKRMLYIDDDYPKEDVKIRLMSKRGYEIKVIYKDSEPYVHFIGLAKEACGELKYAVCEPKS